MRKLTVGVCGGVAAYKAAELVRELQRSGLDPHVVMTASAEQFLRPLTFEALTGHKVINGQWHEDAGADPAGQIEHIAEAQSSLALIVAPATANTLARFAHGLADDFLSTLYLAITAPVVLAPAMNVNMWNHPATQHNLSLLRARGNRIVEPGSGYLACGMTGSGRLAEIPTIVAAVLEALQTPTPSPEITQDLAAETILITAGGTREPVDPVRFLGNRSSGRMGYALAEAALDRGARVLLISAPTALLPPPACELIPVTTAAEMAAAALAHLPHATIVLKAAAVADFRPRAVAPHKLDRASVVTLALEPTEDIVRQLVDARPPGTLVIAFAAEFGPNLPRAREKLRRKGADAIVFNDISLPGLGFDSDHNAATFLTPTTAIELPAGPKRELADRLLDQVLKLRQAHPIPHAPSAIPTPTV